MDSKCYHGYKMQLYLQMKSDCRLVDTQIDQIQHNRVIPATPISCSTQTCSPPGLSSVNKQKHNVSAHDPAAVTSHRRNPVVQGADIEIISCSYIYEHDIAVCMHTPSKSIIYFIQYV